MSSLPIDYRPTSFDEFIGSENSIKTLESKMKKDDPPHSYLIYGPSGCGKTTLGRIIAAHFTGEDYENLNKSMNYKEVDGADAKGIASIRGIKKRMKLSPVGDGEALVWVIDECHKITGDAKDALLKALEDTPKHVYFILCTNEPEKLKVTIKRRCLPIEVFPVEEEELIDYLKDVIDAEEAKIPDDAIEAIVDQSMGSPGIALQQLESIIDLDPDDIEDQIKNYESIETKSIDLCRALIKKSKWPSVVKILNNGLLDSNVEGVRIAVLRYAVSILRKKDDGRAYLIADSFKDPFYVDAKERLVLACYEALE